MTRIQVLIAVIVACVGTASGADMPDDAKREIAAFVKKKADIDAKAVSAIAKEREKLITTLTKAIDRETKARHSAEALAIKDYLESLPEATSADAQEKK